MKKYNIGIDLAITGAHRASIYDVESRCMLDKSFSFENSFTGYEKLLNRIYKVVSGNDVTLSFVMEPTSLAWMPISCYLISRGHIVYRVSTQKSFDFRKFLAKYIKSDRIDSQALARMLDVDSLTPDKLYLPPAHLGALSLKSKHMAKIIKEASVHKLRIQSIFTMINPGVLKAFKSDKFSKAARVFYRNFLIPANIVSSTKEIFITKFQELAGDKVDAKTLEFIYNSAQSICQIYSKMNESGKLPFDFAAVEEEILTELKILECLEEEITRLQNEINVLYKEVDPYGILTSIRGIGEKIAPAVFGIVGDVARFPNIRSFKCFFGFISRKKQTSNKEIKGLRINKAAQKLLKSYLYLAAETARQWDPEFCAFYERLVNKGHHHFSAIAACANKMAGRIYSILKRMKQFQAELSDPTLTEDDKKQKAEKLIYQIRNYEGKVISSKEARQLILDKKAGTDLTHNKSVKPSEEEQNNRESSQPVSQINGNPRQSSARTDSLKRSGKTLPAKKLLTETISTLLGEDCKVATGKDLEKVKLQENFAKLKKVIEANNAVDKLCKTGGKNK